MRNSRVPSALNLLGCGAAAAAAALNGINTDKKRPHPIIVDDDEISEGELGVLRSPSVCLSPCKRMALSSQQQNELQRCNSSSSSKQADFVMGETHVGMKLSDSQDVNQLATTFNPSGHCLLFSAANTGHDSLVVTLPNPVVVSGSYKLLPEGRSEDGDFCSNLEETPQVNFSCANLSPCVRILASVDERSPRDRLQRHRLQVAGNVQIPEVWNGEDQLHDWISTQEVEEALRPPDLMKARAALVNAGRSTVLSRAPSAGSSNFRVVSLDTTEVTLRT